MSALTYATAQVLRVLPRARVSRVFGKLADVRWPAPLGRAVVGIYSRAYDVRFDECMAKDGWESFDHFFTRALKAGARPVDDRPDVVVSPADGRLESAGPIDETTAFVVKGRPYSVAELLGDERDAARFKGGAGCVIYLSPRDYHRVHSPVDGVMRKVVSLPGDYYPVNSIGIKHVPNLFVRNRRVAIHIDTERFGRVAVVMVVAMIVGRITVSGIDERDVPLGEIAFEPGRKVARGDEIGMFHLGSTAVCFFEKRAAGEWLEHEGPVRYGAAMLRMPATRASSREGERA